MTTQNSTVTKEGTLGDRLARFRKEKGMTQTELAKKMGIIQVLISDYENNKLRPHPDVIVGFAQALQLTTDEILGLKKTGTEGNTINLRLLKRMKKIEELPKNQQKILIGTIDTFLKGAAVKRKK